MTTVSMRGVVQAVRTVFPFVAVAAAFLHALTVSWRKWGNLLVDGGRELVIPQRLAEGGELYLTVRNLYGPLPAWLNAALFRMFGVHLDVLVAAGVTTAAVMALALYLLARRFATPLLATAISVCFVYVSAFGHLVPNPSFNFVIPYAYAATYGITLATLSLLFLVRHVQRDSDADLLVSLGLAVGVALCKIEPTLAIAAAHAFLLALSAAAGMLTRRRVAAYAIAAGAVLGIYGAIALRVGPGLWRDNMLSAANSSVARYALQTMGLDDVPASLRAAATSAILLLASAGASALVAFVADRWPTVRALPPVVAATAGGILFAASAGMPSDLPLRALPFVALAVLATIAVRFASAPEDRRKVLAHGVVWVFALGALSRLLLRTVPYHYGFYLVPVPIVAAAIAGAGGLREALGLRSWPRLSEVPVVGLLGGITFACFVASSALYDLHRVRLESDRGSLLLLPNDQAARGAALLGRVPRAARVIAVPFGMGAVFMSGRHWGDATFSYFPTDLAGSYDDGSLVRRWSENPPDAFLYFANDMREFGYRGFGIDYGMEALAWIARNYEPASAKDAPIILLRPRLREAAP